MKDTNIAAANRKAQRHEWKVVRASLTDPDSPEPPVSPEKAIGMMWQLTLDAWAMTGRALPDYSRSQTPLHRFIRSQ